ncbi:Hpt domain-containing protein [Bradyrhizobium sp. WD16]|uniref:Hpt domain-containing protein n=1 Tax=Bradyrhizobium sp. WD16 TaxID=1521768 RepID=UPI0020A47574|nr:Hpt domain-containing protein [Bradyrhizobium sp. WD16]UTD28444.1 histidine kinase [Bradyrhizobium sp. WD16]
MTLSPQWIEWMPSPPLVPDDAPLDLAHLERMTLGDASLEREVLAMFAAQSVDLVRRLSALSDDAAMLVHTLKGSARAIGAVRVAEAAAGLETALRRSAPAGELLATLEAAVTEVRTVIGARLKRS